MTEQKAPPPSRDKLSHRVHDCARGFLSALFMGVRTAQIHDASNKAFDNAISQLHRSAEQLYSATGGFSIQFVQESAFLNGIRLRFEGGAFASMRTLRGIMESHEMGGIEMKTPPTNDAIRRLILLFSGAPQEQASAFRESLKQDQISMLGVQRFADGEKAKADRKTYAVQSYAKLVLSLREQFERIDEQQQGDWATLPPARLRAIRVVQDLVELCADRADFILRLSTNTSGAAPEELLGANACLLTIAMGQALGLQRQEQVDLSVAALFHHIGFRAGKPDVKGISTSIARLVAESSVGRSSYTRAFVMGEQNKPFEGKQKKSHVYSRLVSVAVAYTRLLAGLETESGRPVPPVQVLETLLKERTGRFDPRMVDLLINVLRAYPVGVEVVLDNGQDAMVLSHAGGSRWDRPLVRVRTDPPKNLDLMVKDRDRFVTRIASTKRFSGGLKEQTLDEVQFPPVLSADDLVLAEAPPPAPALPESALVEQNSPAPESSPSALPAEALQPVPDVPDSGTVSASSRPHTSPVQPESDTAPQTPVYQSPKKRTSGGRSGGRPVPKKPIDRGSVKVRPVPEKPTPIPDEMVRTWDDKTTPEEVEELEFPLESRLPQVRPVGGPVIGIIPGLGRFRSGKLG